MISPHGDKAFMIYGVRFEEKEYWEKVNLLNEKKACLDKKNQAGRTLNLLLSCVSKVARLDLQ